jgi:hypothetical protein
LSPFVEDGPRGVARYARGNFLLVRAKFSRGGVISFGPFAGESFSFLQRLGGILAASIRLAYLAANAVQKIFCLLLGRVKIMDKIASLDEPEFKLCECAQFL